MKFLRMGFQAPTLHLVFDFLLLAPPDFSFCPVMWALFPFPLAPTLQHLLWLLLSREKTSSESASGSSRRALPQVTRGISLAGHLLLALGSGIWRG